MGIEAAAILGGTQLLGGYMQGKAAQNAANTSAQAQLEAARIAADAAKFRPVGITSRFGTSNFTTDAQGNVTGAGYTVSPELQGYQNRLMGLAGQGLTQAEQAQQQYAPLAQGAQGLFNLGQQYIAQSPEQVAQDYMAKQQALLAPSREQQSAQLMNQLSNTGRTGLSVAQGGSLQAANPEFAALANARAMQDLQLAAQAQQAGQQATTFGAGLLGTGSNLLGNYYGGQTTALSPFQTNIGLTSNLEQLGQQPLDIGAQIGGRTATAGANVGNSLLQGGLSAARTAQAAGGFSPLGTALSGAASSPWLQQGISNWLSSNTGINSPSYQYNAPYYQAQQAGLGQTGDYGLVW